MISWTDASEIVGGLVLDGKIPETAVRPELFTYPYNDIIKSFKNGVREISDLIELYGLNAIQPLLDCKKVLSENMQNQNWIAILENSCSMFQAGSDLEEVSKKMKRGEPTDLSILTTISLKAQQGSAQHLVPASKIKSQAVVFHPSGWPPLDDHLVGLPEAGLVVVGARPGTGKTWWAITLAYHYLKAHPDKKVCFFSVEMFAEEIRERIDHMSKDPIPDDILDRFIIDDSQITAEQAINRASTIDDVGIVFIDYVDLIVKESSEPEYTKTYVTLAKGAKALHCPIILLSQLSGNYDGGLPRPQHLRYTRLAEAVAWMILMLWNPSKDSFEDTSNLLPVMNNQAYCIAWKVKNGYPNHKEDNPGAIAIGFRGESWHPCKSKWFALTKEEQTANRNRKKN